MGEWEPKKQLGSPKKVKMEKFEGKSAERTRTLPPDPHAAQRITVEQSQDLAAPVEEISRTKHQPENYCTSDRSNNDLTQKYF